MTKKPIVMNFFIWIFLLLWAVSGMFAQAAHETESVLSVLIREALENNPRLEAAAIRSLSAEKAVPQAGALPDPQLTFGLVNLPVNSFSFNQEPMTGKIFSVMQMFPFPGKLAIKTEMAELEALAAGFQHAEVRNQLIQMVKNAFYNLYGIDRALETVEKNKILMEQFVHVAETKYATGSGLQQDVLRAQVELTKLDDDLVMWQQKRLAAEAVLNSLLSRPVDSPVGKTSPEFPPISEEERMGDSREDIERNRPLLKAWKERLRKAESSVELARRDFWPNFTVGTSYNQRDDLKNGARMYDYVSATVSFNVPLYFKRKQNMTLAEKELELAAVSADYENVVTGILSEIQSLKADLERYRKRVAIYEGGILIQARQSLDSALAGYRVGKVDFLTLINNWMMVQNYELLYHFAMAEYRKSLALYELATGAEPVE